MRIMMKTPLKISLISSIYLYFNVLIQDDKINDNFLNNEPEINFMEENLNLSLSKQYYYKEIQINQ